MLDYHDQICSMPSLAWLVSVFCYISLASFGDNVTGGIFVSLRQKLCYLKKKGQLANRDSQTVFSSQVGPSQPEILGDHSQDTFKESGSDENVDINTRTCWNEMT